MLALTGTGIGAWLLGSATAAADEALPSPLHDLTAQVDTTVVTVAGPVLDTLITPDDAVPAPVDDAPAPQLRGAADDVPQTTGDSAVPGRAPSTHPATVAPGSPSTVPSTAIDTDLPVLSRSSRELPSGGLPDNPTPVPAGSSGGSMQNAPKLDQTAAPLGPLDLRPLLRVTVLRADEARNAAGACAGDPSFTPD
jgi:hypothetical protein